MPSNFDEEFEARLIQHFTAAELVEFLDLQIEDIVDAFPRNIRRARKELEDEL